MTVRGSLNSITNVIFTKDMTTIHKEEGMLDIGKHCSVCQRLDFLPYTCPKCKLSFCSRHREEFNHHKCIVEMRKKQKEYRDVDTSYLPSAKTLFPDVDQMRKEANEKAKRKNDRRGNLVFDRKLGSNGKHSTVENALAKLRRLLGNKTASGSKVKTGMMHHLFGSSSKPSATQKLVTVARLRKAAKGDSRVSPSQRVYVNCLYIDESTGKEQLGKMTPIYVSKSWAVGRMLDSCADLMRIKNVNNRETSNLQKLTMFRGRRPGEKVTDGGNQLSDDKFVYIPANARVNKEIQDGDNVYMIRGAK